MAIAPFFIPFSGLDLRFLRAARLLRILRIAKIGRYNSALSLIRTVVIRRKEELVMTSVLALLLLLVASCLVFHFEHDVQPKSFADIPTTLWWAVVTLTTIGYGDVIPVTAGGKIVTCIFSLLGIAILALPAGILGSGFVQELQRSKEAGRCPHCGGNLGSK